MQVERAILLWERKIHLEREMQEALDPGVGNDVVRAGPVQLRLGNGRLLPPAEPIRLDGLLAAELLPAFLPAASPQVGAMKKEIHRMQMRHAELLRLQVAAWPLAPCWQERWNAGCSAASLCLHSCFPARRLSTSCPTPRPPPGAADA